MKTTSVTILFFLAICVQAQTPEPPATDFTATKEASGAFRFTARCCPLTPIAGAQPPYYTYFWEFGDGNFSFEDSPVYHYRQGGSHQAWICATAHYDDKKRPTRAAHEVIADAFKPGKDPLPDMEDVFLSKNWQIGLKTNRNPRPEEDLVCILSYKNKGTVATDGRLHLFLNEKSFDKNLFQFQEARKHYGETDETNSLSEVTYPPVMNWSALTEGIAVAGDAAPLAYPQPPQDAAAMLEKARAFYREEHIWKFTGLNAGEKRNLFVSLLSTAGMVKDTNVDIHLKAIFEPFDPTVAPEEITYTIKIVASHDPNVISVSDNKVNFRLIGQKGLKYTVHFQNNGEREAKMIKISIDIPEGLDAAKMKPVEWYPKCPICPEKIPETSCLDTSSTQNQLVFTFNNIHLPGSRQKNVSDRDSTKGFVRYRIDAEKNMPKLDFHSRASIVFDKNPPIMTNYSRTHFKPGISPGLKIGYGWSPKTEGQGSDQFQPNSGYLFLGASVSPYKSWRVYPQLELLTGIKARQDLPESIVSDTFVVNIPPGILIEQVNDTISGGSRGQFTFDVPFLLRKNFNRFIGFGIGGGVRILVENGYDTKVINTKSRVFGADPPVPFMPGESIILGSVPYKSTAYHPNIFADLTIGSVRAGPNLGVRAGGFFKKGFQPFVQISLEVKL